MKSEPWKGQERAWVSVSAQAGEREACLSLSHPFLPARHSCLTLQTASSTGGRRDSMGASPLMATSPRRGAAPATSPNTVKSLREALGLGHRLSPGPISCGYGAESQKTVAAPIEEGVGERGEKWLLRRWGHAWREVGVPG